MTMDKRKTGFFVLNSVEVEIQLRRWNVNQKSLDTRKHRYFTWMWWDWNGSSLCPHIFPFFCCYFKFQFSISQFFFSQLFAAHCISTQFFNNNKNLIEFLLLSVCIVRVRFQQKNEPERKYWPWNPFIDLFFHILFTRTLDSRKLISSFSFHPSIHCSIEFNQFVERNSFNGSPNANFSFIQFYFVMYLKWNCSMIRHIFS